MLEYKANQAKTGIESHAPIVERFVSSDAMSLMGWRRFYGDRSSTKITDMVTNTVHPVDLTTSEFGSSTRILKIDPTAPSGAFSGAGQTLVEVEYFAQDAIPNYGAQGYQLSVYYRSNAPQTCGVKAGDLTADGLPTTLTVTPLVMSHESGLAQSVWAVWNYRIRMSPLWIRFLSRTMALTWK